MYPQAMYPPETQPDYEKGVGNQLGFELEVRKGFIRKVYSILSVQLIITAVLAVLPFFSDSFRRFQYYNPAIVILAMVLTVIIMYILVCFSNMARTVPTNYILLAVFTFCEAYMVSLICSRYDSRLVAMAAAFTAVTVIALTLYACVTKTDFTMLGGLLFVLAAMILCFGFTLIFLRSQLLNFVYSCLIVVVFSIYLIYDTQLVVGKGRFQLTPDDYIIGALMLYVDIVVLFLEILKLLGNNRS
eukprot:TRINITY_DN0_c3298_g1_i1.p1 TRINITY_DN0_c3298_g1~~TRINITY_DN0_c3298_g1_i1.p1  ORF type:complete len:244 (-),score=32.96 TRINITY_DN0_c3298_g1_i1:18-749(-)